MIYMELEYGIPQREGSLSTQKDNFSERDGKYRFMTQSETLVMNQKGRWREELLTSSHLYYRHLENQQSEPVLQRRWRVSDTEGVFR